MDINLPGMSGKALLEELKKLEETRNIPVIAVSADALEENIRKALDAGFVSYITKPLDIQIFLTELERVLGQIEKRPHELKSEV
jgi:CheY-like chemotaxis protein